MKHKIYVIVLVVISLTAQACGSSCFMQAVAGGSVACK